MKSNKFTDTEKAILVGRIEVYMEKFTKYFKVGHIRLTEAESKEIAELMRTINPRYNFNYKLNCSSCIREAVTSLSNFYSRERSKVETPVEPELPVEEPEEIELVDDTNAPEEEGALEESSVADEDIEMDDSYYETLDKRSKEYKDWKKSKEV